MSGKTISVSFSNQANPTIKVFGRKIVLFNVETTGTHSYHCLTKNSVNSPAGPSKTLVRVRSTVV
jgi:hypothetical protein